MKLLFLVLDVIGPYIKRRIVMAIEKIVEKYDK